MFQRKTSGIGVNEANTTHLVLELGRIASVHRDRRSVDMQLADDAAATALCPYELRAERSLFRALTQTQQADKNIFLGVLV